MSIICQPENTMVYKFNINGGGFLKYDKEYYPRAFFIISTGAFSPVQISKLSAPW